MGAGIVYFFATGLLFSVVAMVVYAWKLLQANDNSHDRMDFMYKMTHELQTPVSSMRLAADMLAMPSVNTSQERLLKYVRIINEESQRMQAHVENVLNIARSEGDLLVLTKEPIALNELIFQTIDRYNGAIRTDCRATDSVIYADRMHLVNVIHNLVDNAIKYSREGDEVQVKTYNVESNLVIAVRDQGIGIPPEYHTKIFAKFYRVQGNDTTIRGFGLGLSYVQQIAGAHHWKLELESAPAKGSEFRLIIPRESGKELRK